MNYLKETFLPAFFESLPGYTWDAGLKYPKKRLKTSPRQLNYSDLACPKLYHLQR